jgi:chemotaxis protein methyltransferase CheR
MDLTPITSKEFGLFKRFIYKQAGINLSDNKHPLVSGRLAKRLKYHGLKTFDDYYKLLSHPDFSDEQQIAIDLLTTNETHFFREPKHFDHFKNLILQRRVKGKPFRVWSAASSTGEEPFTIAMILAEVMDQEPWEVVGSDISSRVLAQAQLGRYPIARASEIPKHYLTKYCLKGTGSEAGNLLISQELRKHVKFMAINLVQPFPAIGEFDVIFLRNVMIYFDMEKKQQILQQMLPILKPSGYFYISHSESLNGISDAFVTVSPSVYRKR